PRSLVFSVPLSLSALVFFFTDPPTPEIYTLSLHDALPISACISEIRSQRSASFIKWVEIKMVTPSWRARSIIRRQKLSRATGSRSEEHTSELQSRENLVCRLLLEKKKKH